MKFVLAPDKYKGSLTGNDFCEAVEEGLRKVFPEAEVVKRPLADGGDGTLEVVRDYLKASVEVATVKNPLFKDITAEYLLSQDQKTAFIEMSEASGYKLLEKGERNCMKTTSFGTGELIVHALQKGVDRVLLGIGGSATNDGGMGMATALGYRFLDSYLNELKPIGENLINIHKIDRSNVDKRLSRVSVEVACDVTNPFYGENGAAKVYGPQKGASVEEVEHLDRGLQHFAHVIQKTFDIDVQQVSGSGAAGGMGGGAKVFLAADLVSGIDLVKKIANFDAAIEGADWIITGEGQLDAQTLSGKTIHGVFQSAKRKNIPVAAFCGSVTISADEIQKMGLCYAVSIINTIISLDEAKSQSYQNLVQTSYNFASLLKSSLR